MRKLGFTVILISLGLVALIAPATAAQNRNFTLYNDTSDTIDGMWLSTYGDRIWHHVLNFKPIPPGYHAPVSFEQTGPCQVQLRVHLSDETVHEWPAGFNLCKIGSIRIWLDNNGVYQARFQ